MDLLPITLIGFYILKPKRRIYLNPDADLEIIIHKPIKRSVIDSLNNYALIRLTRDTIEEVYRP